MMKYFASIKINSTEFKHFEVQKEVYIYIKQLENAVKYPYISSIKNLYPERFRS